MLPRRSCRGSLCHPLSGGRGRLASRTTRQETTYYIYAAPLGIGPADNQRLGVLLSAVVWDTEGAK